DRELLARFVNSHDAAAFELLFWRHAPTVWGVCRRLLGDSPDAEDAFQAAFVVLACKARSVADGAALAGWLHRVTWRTSLNARKARSRRIAREHAVETLPECPGGDDPACSAADGERNRLIDGELMRLPEKFRLPLLLCDVQGRSHESAAAELGCP